MCLAAACAQAEARRPRRRRRLFDARQWGEAAAAYQSIVEREPGNALAIVRLARARAANGEDAAALDALKAWFATGSGSFQAAMTLPEFESLRSDPRFTAIVEPHRPCNTPEFRQFDFWVGDWDVESAAAPGTVSRNLITRIYDGCTVREEYTTPLRLCRHEPQFLRRAAQGLAPDLDRQPGRRRCTSRAACRARDMVLRRLSDPINVQRITWTPLDDGRVRQHWESTTDGGKSWTTAFDGIYTRRATAAASAP